MLWHICVGLYLYSFGGLYNTSGVPFIDRNLALQVPAVSRCRNLICGVIASIDLELIQKSTGRKLQTPVWLDQPDIRQPRSVTISYTVDSLLLYGVAYWRVTSLYEDDGRPSGFEWVANTRVTVTTDNYGDEVDYYSINGIRVPDSGVGSLVTFQSLLPGVLDDELRPAFQQLLTATGSITNSQDALQTALNISAATGKSLTEVSAALTRGYSGNTTGLSRLGAGISKATLKTGDMNKIMAELNKKFSGQSAARLDTYAGKMGLLTVATEEARETIGKGLLDALSLLGKDTSISSATKLMDDFATSTADAVVGIAVLVKELKKLGETKVGGVLFDVKNIPVLLLYQGNPSLVLRTSLYFSSVY